MVNRGIIQKGEFVVPAAYDHLMDFLPADDLIAYRTNALEWGFIDYSGNKVLSGYQQAANFREELAIVRSNDKFGAIDKAGNWVIAAEYVSLSSFSDGLAWSKKGTAAGYIDKSGKMFIPLPNKVGYDFHGGYAMIGEKINGVNLYGVIDKNGKVIIPIQYPNINHGNNGVIIHGIQGLIGYIVLDDNAADLKPVVPVTASYSQSSLYINGKHVPMDVYNIGGSNYFKLRDLAMALTDTGSRFEVTYDSKLKAINLLAGKPYTPVGKELAVSDQQTNKKATPTTDKIYLDGELAKLAGYTIDGSNYFKLADLAALLKFELQWDAATKRISITTS